MYAIHRKSGNINFKNFDNMEHVSTKICIDKIFLETNFFTKKCLMQE